MPATRAAREHPLPAFRNYHDEGPGDDDDEEGDGSDGEPSAVMAKFDAHDGKAYLVMSNGSHEEAEYHPGDTGCVLAKWPKHSKELQLELPNSAINEDGTLKYTPVSPEAKAKGKKGEAKAKGKAKAKVKAAGKRPAAADHCEDDDEPNKKAKTMEDNIKANIDRIPADARIDGMPSDGATCYTIEMEEGTEGTYSVQTRDLQRSPSYYIANVTAEHVEIAKATAGPDIKKLLEGKSVNPKGGLQISLGNDPALSFKAACHLARASVASD